MTTKVPYYLLRSVASLLTQLADAENKRKTVQFLIDGYDAFYKTVPRPDDFEGFKEQAMYHFDIHDEDRLIATLEDPSRLKKNVEQPVADIKEALLKYGIEVDLEALYG